MTIGIIGAFKEEIEKFIDVFNLVKDETTNREVYIGKFNNKNLVVANSGIGKVNSAAMTQYLIDKYNINIIINSGCAGSLTDNVKIMDVVLCSYATYHDFNPVRVMKYSTPDDGLIKADEALLKIAENALNKTDIYNYFIAPIASGDSFVTNSKERDDIFERTKAYAVDMESASIAHISKLNNVPFISLRTISDFSDGNDDFEKEAAYNSSKLVKEIINEL